jgi:hypothetical protein
MPESAAVGLDTSPEIAYIYVQNRGDLLPLAAT